MIIINYCYWCVPVTIFMRSYIPHTYTDTPILYTGTCSNTELIIPVFTLLYTLSNDELIQIQIIQLFYWPHPEEVVLVLIVKFLLWLQLRLVVFSVAGIVLIYFDKRVEEDSCPPLVFHCI